MRSPLKKGCGLLDTRELMRGFWIRSCLCDPQLWYLTDQAWREHIDPEQDELPVYELGEPEAPYGLSAMGGGYLLVHPPKPEASQWPGSQLGGGVFCWLTARCTAKRRRRQRLEPMFRTVLKCSASTRKRSTSGEMGGNHVRP